MVAYDNIEKKLYELNNRFREFDFSDWQCAFISSCFNQYQRGCDLSEKQMIKINDFHNKIDSQLNTGLKPLTRAFEYREYIANDKRINNIRILNLTIDTYYKY